MQADRLAWRHKNIENKRQRSRETDKDEVGTVRRGGYKLLERRMQEGKKKEKKTARRCRHA